LAADLEVYPGWAAGDLLPGLLGAVRCCFRYGAGEDRATGYLHESGGQPWPPDLAERGPRLLARLEVTPGVKFGVVAFQAYRDGAGCGWHADTPFAAQAILSLGVTRSFAVRRPGGAARVIPVRDGDLLFMPAGFQQEWEHAVPEEDVPGERCSLVFRTKGA
jgi:alkylated DNA repair dioxygenase AlkB